MIRWRSKNERNEEGRTSASALSMPDAELVHAARRGDKKAFVEIVARHQAMVCGVALGILGDFAASEDAAQEAFLTAWRRFHDLREPERLRGWLGQIARNAALGQLRRVKGHEPLDDEELTLADASPTPDERAASEEEAALVRDSLARLPESYRLPLILFYREGQSVRAVAESLGLSEDAVKQRLARGREMLRDEMSGLIEAVLTRTGPTAIFTMTIAAAIGALATPAVLAGSVFSAASAATGTASTTAGASTPFLTAMSTTKTSLITAALVAAVCIPVGYHVGTDDAAMAPIDRAQSADIVASPADPKARPSFENSAMFAQWRELHEIHGTTAEAMPAIYWAIADISDPFRRRAFRAALIAEWVQLDPANGLAFFIGQRDTAQRRQFFEEWLARDSRAAVDALMVSGSGWESVARNSLLEIARRVPGRVAAIVAQLPESTSYWDTKVRDAFALVAENGLEPARIAAEAITGPNREQALGGVAKVWAKQDLDAAIAWVKALPGEVDRDELIRAALLGLSAVNPVSALERVGTVPPGGRESYFATTTGARVLSEAVKTDYDGTVAWLAAHPGRLGREDLMGLAAAVTDRINSDAVGFLNRHAADGTLEALLPAINSAILNDASGKRTAIWDWLKTQPENPAHKELRQQVLAAAGHQEPGLALRMVADLPRTAEGDAQAQTLASSLFNGGSALHRFDKLLEQAPERMRQMLIETAFNNLRGDLFTDPQAWISRLAQLPEASRARGAEAIAQAWASHRPEEAVDWVRSLAPGEIRTRAVAGIASIWVGQDSHGAAEWVASMAPGVERDHSTRALVFATAERYPHEAWNWALTIGDSDERHRAAGHAARIMAARDPATARQWVETGPFTPEFKAQFQASLQKSSPTPGAR